jgi:hypothetical protein
MSEGTKIPFRRELKASVPLELTDVLDFSRRELGKLNWKEESDGAVVTGEKQLSRTPCRMARRYSSLAARTMPPA